VDSAKENKTPPNKKPNAATPGDSTQMTGVTPCIFKEKVSRYGVSRQQKGNREHSVSIGLPLMSQ